MSFAQSLGRKAMGAQKQFMEQTMRDFMAACETQAAKGYCVCQKDYPRPSWWLEEHIQTLKQRGFDIGFLEFFLYAWTGLLMAVGSNFAPAGIWNPKFQRRLGLDHPVARHLCWSCPLHRAWEGKKWGPRNNLWSKPWGTSWQHVKPRQPRDTVFVKRITHGRPGGWKYSDSEAKRFWHRLLGGLCTRGLVCWWRSAPTLLPLEFGIPSSREDWDWTIRWPDISVAHVLCTELGKESHGRPGTIYGANHEGLHGSMWNPGSQGILCLSKGLPTAGVVVGRTYSDSEAKRFWHRFLGVLCTRGLVCWWRSAPTLLPLEFGIPSSRETRQFGRCPMCRTQVTGATRGLFMWSHLGKALAKQCQCIVRWHR